MNWLKAHWMMLVGGAGALFLLYWLYQRGQASQQAAAAPIDQSGIDPNTGMPYASEYSYGGYGTSPVSGVGTTEAAPAATTNPTNIPSTSTGSSVTAPAFNTSGVGGGEGIIGPNGDVYGLGGVDITQMMNALNNTGANDANNGTATNPTTATTSPVTSSVLERIGGSPARVPLENQPQTNPDAGRTGIPQTTPVATSAPTHTNSPLRPVKTPTTSGRAVTAMRNIFGQSLAA